MADPYTMMYSYGHVSESARVNEVRVWTATLPGLIHPIVFFGEEDLTGWQEFWCEENGLTMEKLYVMTEHIERLHNDTIHRVDDLYNQEWRAEYWPL